MLPNRALLPGRMLLLVSLLATGCADATAPPAGDNADASVNPGELDQSTAESRASCAIDPAQLTNYTRTIDVEWAYRSLRIPGGFGGLYGAAPGLREIEFYLV